ncbi:bifunctional 5,10-methylenetetrahydrofolate dehydrogenase/5,10-methenyltetrahydrofolate cyclohydrolase [Parvibacter caecicola]|uniref:Bifunctional protein FolD n=1 Tax=Parvibacter caecicola TaxID=747645 RepID=A0A4T9T9E2_9ACTN|nr:bifunctional 5,10-methylenetetrahydrofolate dehydrogenase/5,10-methenyltetrahydrofolate cyclohydrolase [Parvibacter caecicola]TJW09665.1 bifunctional 5,10-methylenetetrahydrofolate dehydrogenase/5,10-methenyltetrahydrofolate cyclohydrolase [Parvibacter caecicola]
MADLLLGKPVGDALSEKTAALAEELTAQGIQPTLAIVRVGERPDDLSYERGACKRAEALGIAVRKFLLPEDASQDDVLAAIAQVNDDASIHGCLMFRPLPKGIDEAAVCNALDPAKDVDGITAGSLAGVFMDTGVGFPPCTAQACVEILDHYGFDVEGKSVAVVGRSLVIGKPVAMMLLARNATVTLCHSRSRELPTICREADIVVYATGRPRAYSLEHFSGGQTVLDVGINVDEEGNLCGDVDFAAAEPVVGAITPVPRGVGSVTTAVLMRHVVEAAVACK